MASTSASTSSSRASPFPSAPLPSVNGPTAVPAARAPLFEILRQHRQSSALSGSPTLPPVPEHELLRDIIYIFQGIDGRHLKFSTSSTSPERGLNFTPPASHCIPAPTRTLLVNLAALGWLYRDISAGISAGPSADPTGTEPAKEVGQGMVKQSLCSAVNAELTEYFRLVAVLEGELNSLDAPAVEGATGQEGFKGLIARLVSSSTHLAAGPLLTSLNTYTTHGDPTIAALSSSLLKTLSAPWFSMLGSWIWEGELRDPWGEFFIVPLEVEDEPEGSEGKGWNGVWEFRKEMLPGFLEEEFGKKIFSTGKSLHFMRHSCQDSEWVMGRSLVEGTGRPLQYADMAGLERSIDLAYQAASQRLFKMFVDKYRLLDHLKGIKDYLMLGKGDFVEILMENLGASLSKPANMLYRHNLTTTLDLAIKNSTPPSIPISTSHLDARMLGFSQGEIGWDVFTLEYRIDEPLTVVLTTGAMESYTKVFRHLWQIKRVEFGLRTVWRRVVAGEKTFKRVPGLGYTMHKTRLAIANMRFFLTQLESYSHSEVIDCAFLVLQSFILKGEGGLDGLIEAHRVYLRKLEKMLLEGTRRGGAKRDAGTLLEALREMFVVVLRYRESVDSLCDYALTEAARLDSFHDQSRGISTSSLPASIDPVTALSKIQSRLEGYYSEFTILAQELVTALGTSTDLDMRFLSVRENYNDFYCPPKTTEEIQKEQEAIAAAKREKSNLTSISKTL